ncbi:MAG: (deoxy)nucleoside triphosphate pyrophosphohydrolase [Candidatus Marinimicrobia bacterium]|nr:(deoxy)nucleoside triphosphate pyrophosphohydrolase [Candidatus Neomarinimicrobiota bacterium]
MLQVVAGIIELDGFVLLCRRRANERRFPRKWEFPGGKVEDDESPEAAIDRELREELGIRVKTKKPYARYTFQYDGELPFELIFFTILDHDHTIQNLQFESMAWVLREKLNSYDLLEGDKPLVRMLQEIDPDKR